MSLFSHEQPPSANFLLRSSCWLHRVESANCRPQAASTESCRYHAVCLDLCPPQAPREPHEQVSSDLAGHPPPSTLRELLAPSAFLLLLVSVISLLSWRRSRCHAASAESEEFHSFCLILCHEQPARRSSVQVSGCRIIMLPASHACKVLTTAWLLTSALMLVMMLPIFQV